jgi:hypothetical protein
MVIVHELVRINELLQLMTYISNSNVYKGKMSLEGFEKHRSSQFSTEHACKYKRVTVSGSRCTPPACFHALDVSEEVFYQGVRAEPGGHHEVSKCLCINLWGLSPLKLGECTLNTYHHSFIGSKGFLKPLPRFAAYAACRRQ